MCYYNYFGVTYLLAATIMLHKGVSYNFAYLKAFYPLFLIYMLPDCQVPFAFTMLLQLCWCHVFVSCNIKEEGVQPQTFFIPFSVTIGFPASPVYIGIDLHRSAPASIYIARGRGREGKREGGRLAGIWAVTLTFYKESG